MADWHNRFEKIFQIIPELLLRHRAVCLKELIQLRHPLRLPARKGHASEILQNIICHLPVVLPDLILLIIQRGGSVLQRVKEIGPGPVKDRHKIVGYYLNAKFRQIAQRLFIILDIPVPGGQADLNIIMDIYTLHHFHMKAVPLNLLPHFLNLMNLPHLSGRLIMESPDKSRHSGNLPDLFLRDTIVSLPVPAKCHLHGSCLLLPYILVSKMPQKESTGSFPVNASSPVISFSTRASSVESLLS